MPEPASCRLDRAGLESQSARWRAIGRGAQVIERSPRNLCVRIGSEVASPLVSEVVAVESECCPFFELVWEPADRRLQIGVGEPEQQPALEAISFALGLPPAS